MTEDDTRKTGGGRGDGKVEWEQCKTRDGRREAEIVEYAVRTTSYTCQNIPHALHPTSGTGELTAAGPVGDTLVVLGPLQDLSQHFFEGHGAPPRVSVHHGVSVLPCIVPHARLWLLGAQKHPLFQPCRPRWKARSPMPHVVSTASAGNHNDVLVITSLVPELGVLHHASGEQTILPARPAGLWLLSGDGGVATRHQTRSCPCGGPCIAHRACHASRRP